MDIELLRRDLASAAAHVVAPTDLADRITGSARRRHRRRLTVAAGAVVLVVLAAATGTVAMWQGSGTVTAAADHRLELPTRGDLAGDQDFLASAVRTWEDDLQNSKGFRPDGERQPAHVYWAGTTPAGRAAIVLQRVATDQGWSTIVGLVGTDAADGRFAALGLELQRDAGTGTGAFLFGPGNRTLIVLEHDAVPHVSTGVVHGTDGKPSRSWQPLPAADGVSMLQLPDGTAAIGVRVTIDEPPGDMGRRTLPVIASHYRQVADTGLLDDRLPERRLAWTGDVRPMRVGAHRTAPEDITITFYEALERAGAVDLPAYRIGNSYWYVLAGLPDGSTAIVGEHQQDADPSHLWTVLTTADGAVRSVLWGGQVDPTATLPVAVRMPEAQGWVVAAHGSTLRYRTAVDGPWSDAGRDAALLPDQAVQVEVTAPDAAPAVVALGS